VESLPTDLKILLQSETAKSSETIQEDVGGEAVSSTTGSIEDDSSLTGDKLNTHLAYLTVKILLTRPLLIQSVMENRDLIDCISNSGITENITANFTDIW
jgi:hypothetical protein